MLIPLTLLRDQPLQRQLYEQLRELIATARLQPGSPMPSTRLLADRFGISRTTVLLTYERLIAEGFLETRPAKGTFVADRPARTPSLVALPVSAPDDGGGQDEAAADGRIGSPDPSLFLASRWYGVMRTALNSLGAHVRAEHPAGNPASRQAIARWLSTSRGLAVSADQVIVLNGRQQALHLAGHLAPGPGARIVVEDPCNEAAATALASEGAELVRIPVDAGGLRTSRLPEGEAALIHVTPEHQRPLGVVLERDRRIALLDWAARSGALVLEEDCDGELRYGDVSLPSLMSLDSAERVILLGGFCASLGPWVGLAYLALPRRLIGPALAALRRMDDGRRGLEELALAELLNSGGYARHLHRLSKTYAGRRDALLAALRQHFGPTLVWGEHAGLHLAWLPAPEAGAPRYLAALARRCGLEADALPADSPGRQVVLLGFGGLSVPQIESRVSQFSALVQSGDYAAAMGAD